MFINVHQCQYWRTLVVTHYSVDSPPRLRSGCESICGPGGRARRWRGGGWPSAPSTAPAGTGTQSYPASCTGYTERSLLTWYNASKLTLQFVYVNFYVTTENWTIIETLQRNISGSQSWWCNTLNKVLVAEIESWESEECWRQRLLPTRECGDQSDCAGSTELSSSVVIPTRPQPSPAPSSGSQDTSQDQAAAALAWLLVTAPPRRHLSYVRGNRAVNEISQSCSQSIFREGTSLQLLAPSCWNRLLKKLSHLFTSIQTLWQMGV